MSGFDPTWSATRLLLGSLALSACSSGYTHGDAYDPEDDPAAEEDDADPPPAEPPGPASEPLCGDDARDVPGPRLLRRLTTEEFEVSVRQALGLDALAWAGPTLPPDPAAETGFTNDAERLRVTESFAIALEQNAAEVGALVGEPERLAALLPCAAPGGSSDDACADDFLDLYGRRLLRRSLSDAERDRYHDLRADIVAGGEDFGSWVRWTTQTLLQSPNFIYRVELGDRPDDAEGWYDLRPTEVATLLAFTFTGAPPDDALLDDAESGGLDTPEQIAQTAAALARGTDGLPRAGLRERLQTFHRQWLGLSTLTNVQKDPERYPGFTEDVKASMLAEADAFIDRVVLEQGGGVAELLTAGDTELDATLAAYYGFGDGTGLTARPAGWGVGLLSLGAVQATHSTFRATSPTQRGKLVRSRLLCTEPPAPPANVGDLPPIEDTQTTRQRYEAHVSDPSCTGCHLMLDPIGFGLEGIDASGRFRDQENGAPLDLTGSIMGLDGESVDFEGPQELAEALAGAEDPALCLSAQLATFALGLPPEETECIVDTPAELLASGERGIVDVYVEMASVPHFWRRQNR